MEDAFRPQARRLCVLKFGSSVLRTEEDYPAVALEIYRHVRDGEKVVAVVSALAGETDSLFDQARRVGGGAPDAMVARLARVGELHSAALMVLALSKVGVGACTMDPEEMALLAEGDPLDSDLTALDERAVRAKLNVHDVVVVPGFTAGHAEHGVVTLGRGGTDLSAVFFAARLDAHRVRLIKDVDGVYAEDPARNPEAERFTQMSYVEAAEASSGLIQPKAIRAAEAEDVLIEVAALGSGDATTIAHLPSRKARPRKPERVRVALLGCGAVGAGVLSYLQSRPDLFEVNPVLVRRPAIHSEAARFTDRLESALSGKIDIVVELLGGADHPADLMRSALRAGIHVVTANKAALAKHYESLRAREGMLRYSGAVGGGAPILEALGRLRGSVVSVEGLMNGTCNYILGRLVEGSSLEDAVAMAQELNFAEADPTLDIDGHDAADKLSILVREAFRIVLPPERIARASLRHISSKTVQAVLDRGEVLKQVGSCSVLADGGIAAEVKVVALPIGHPLANARDEENRFLVRDIAGDVHQVFGKGAGRWPTATAVFADVMDVQRALVGREMQSASDFAPSREGERRTR